MATTDNAVYFCGYLPDQFTGWGGTGAPAYAGLSGGNSSVGNVPYGISINPTVTTLSNGLYGCLWGNFTDTDTGEVTTVNTFSTAIAGWLGYPGSPSATNLVNYTLAVYHCAAGYLLVKQMAGASNTYKLYLTPSITDNTQYIDLGLQIAVSTAIPFIIAFSLSGGGTSSGSVTAYVNGNLVGTWNGDLTAYADFSAVSFHRIYSTSSNNYTTIFYCLVTNFSLVSHFLDVQKTAAVGSDTGWGTNTASFATMPANYADYTDGLYGDTVGDKMTLTYAATPNTVGYEPKAVCISHGMITGTAGGDIEVQGMVKNPTTGVETTLGTHPVSTTGAQDTFSMTVNPATGEKWALAEVNSTEFGLIRTK